MRICDSGTWSWTDKGSSGVPWPYAIGGTSPSDVWVARKAGNMFHWNGTAWSMVSLTGGWRGVWGTAANDVFAVGSAGVIAHYNGSAWSTMPSPTLENLRRVWGSSPTDVYATGSNATILHYDGSAWTAMPTYQGSRCLNNVWGSPHGSVWAVGGTGPALVLRGHRGAAVTTTPSSAALHSLGATTTLVATVKDAGLSPVCGMLVVTVIHATSDRAVHRHRSCVAPPQVFGSLCWSTSNRPVPPAAENPNVVSDTA